MEQQIGPYRVEGELGRGGMGVVYRALDTRLDRVVAIKALPEELAKDAGRLERFEREARTLASLNHPNLAGIHGVEEQGGHKYLVLEFVDGETLAEVLDRGPMSVGDALDVAGQIAAGVEAAHEAGIIHRDLKPANIKITPDGKVKVLDFGLAKADESSTASSGLSQNPTITTPAVHSPTMPGVILGTAAYMSPEQARGRRVDKRTDIWSFGVIVYEMLTGASPFIGETVSDSIGAVLHKTIELERLPRDLPRGVRRVLKRCIERDKAQRYRDIGDVRLELAAAGQGSVDETAVGPSSGSHGVLLWVALLLIGVVIAGGSWWFGKSSAPVPEAPGPLHVTAPMPESPSVGRGRDGGFEVSPTERLIASIGYRPGDELTTREPMIYTQDLASGEKRWLEGTQNARWLTFSPDGSEIGFSWFDPQMAREEFRRIPVRGGPMLTVFTDPDGAQYDMRGPEWIEPGSLLVMNQRNSTLHRVGLADGVIREVCSVEFEGGWSGPMRPERLDEHTVLFSVVRASAMGTVDLAILEVDLDSGDHEVVMEGASFPTVLDSGHLLFIRGSTLCVVGFDIATRRVHGAVRPLVDGVYMGLYQLAPSGDLVVLLGSELADSRIMAIGADRVAEQIIDAARPFLGGAMISPDGTNLLTQLSAENSPPQSVVFDLRSGAMHRVPSDGGVVIAMGWHYDGRLLATRFQSYTLAETILYDPATGRVEEALPEADGVGFQVDQSAVGQTNTVVFYYAPRDNTEPEGIYLLDLNSELEGRRAKPVVTRQGEVNKPRPSPNGEWLAYESNASGVWQVVVQPLDIENPSAPVRVFPVSLDGGSMPVWSPDGETLYFIAPGTRNVMRVGFDAGDQADAAGEPNQSPTISRPTLAFKRSDIPFKELENGFDIQTMPDGRLIYLEEPLRDNTPTEFSLILNWLDSVRSEFPTD